MAKPKKKGLKNTPLKYLLKKIGLNQSRPKKKAQKSWMITF